MLKATTTDKSSLLKKVRSVAGIFLLLLAIYTALRLVFYLLYFQESSFKRPGMIWYWGMRMDFSILFYINLPFIFYLFLLHDLILPRLRNGIAITLLSLINVPMLAIDFLDLAYYRYTLRRSNADLLYVWKDSAGAVVAQWQEFAGYIAGFVFTAGLFVWVAARILRRDPSERMPDEQRGNVSLPHPATSPGPGNVQKRASFGVNMLLLLAILAAGGIPARGLSSGPIIPSTPLLYFPAPLQHLVSNSTFSFLYSVWKKENTLSRKAYFSDRTADSLFSIVKQYEGGVFTKKNVVVFMMETLSKEYLDPRDPLKAYTPFLDSIMDNSIVCENAFANGYQSNQGIVAVLGSIPPFFQLPFYYSSYSNNPVRGLGTILKEEGYQTGFFLGAEYDHFGFGKFMKLIGIGNYYSRDTYNNDADYNGAWGIADHRFLPYAAGVINGQSAPFLAVIYNLSTHPPFIIPDAFKKRFAAKGQSDIQNSISYYDQALRLFFDKIRGMPWYNNTVFLFCADHSAGGLTGKKFQSVASVRIPLFVHIPGKRGKTVIAKPVQQLDVAPTILDLLHYPRPFLSFGASVFDTSARYVYKECFGNYELMNNAWLLGYSEEEERVKYLFNYASDPDLKRNVMDSAENAPLRAEMQRNIRAILQQFSNSMLGNRLWVK